MLMFRLFIWISMILTWPLISFGALVRLKGAGMACPDWPLCYGKLIPPPGLEIALEVGHRFVAVVLGMAIIGMCFASFAKGFPKKLRFYSFGVLAIVIAQGIFGALTVTMALNPIIVTLHLVGGNLLFWTLVYLYAVYARKSEGKGSGRGVCSAGTLWALNAIVWAILFSGGLNSTHYAGHQCQAFPLCHANDPFSFNWNAETGFSTEVHADDLVLDEDPVPSNKLEWIHMAHRVMAMFGGAAVILLALLKIKPGGNPAWSAIRLGLCLLVLLEIPVGVLNALFSIPVPISMLHTTLASTLIGVLAFASGLRVAEGRTRAERALPAA